MDESDDVAFFVQDQVSHNVHLGPATTRVTCILFEFDHRPHYPWVMLDPELDAESEVIMAVPVGHDDNESSSDRSRSNAIAQPADSFESTRSWMPQVDHSLTLPLGEHLSGIDLPANLRDHPRYRVIRLLGQGGMGMVFLAEHRLMGRPVALKIIRLGFAESQTHIERFLREIRATAKLSHPNIVVAHDAEASPDHLFLVMEYLEGRDLRSLAWDSGGLDPAVACSYTYQAALALRHAHRRGVIHRDIKPGNMFLVPDETGTGPGMVKVLDFGLAKVLSDSSPGTIGTPAGFAMGTRGFMSPEQSTDARAVGVHADIFSLGRTLYFLLSGRLPYPNGIESLMTEEAGQDPVIPLDVIRPGIPADVQAVMRRMSARHSADRFQSCDEVLAALAPLCQTSAPVQASAQHNPASVRKRWWQLW